MKPISKRFYTPKDIAQILNISYDAALLLIKTEIPYVMSGRCYRVRFYKFREWYESQEKLR